MSEWTLCFCVRHDNRTRDALREIHAAADKCGGGFNAEVASDGYHVDVWGPVALRDDVDVLVRPLVDAGLVLDRQVYQ